MLMNYFWDEQSHLFRHSSGQDFAYSDGKEVEDRLLTLVSNAADRSTFSTELLEAITDWPSEYHLSRGRHCLVRPLGIRPGDRVLELGCGCGAITRYLGEMGAKVAAVEGSLSRARVAAERCRDLANVRVIVDDLLRFRTEERFDWVLLIGVLEYAALFSGHENPFQHYLHSVSQFLAPQGSIVVAIENKLGLKYLNGCEEDHLGIPFYGVQNLYDRRSPRTFSHQELIGQLSGAGLVHSKFFYPFPDYKLPSVILADDALTDPEFDPVDLLARCHARDYSGSLYRGFDEALVFSALGNNRLIGDLSNSFLVVASPTQKTEQETREIAAAFSVHRAPAFNTQTTFARRGDEIRVSKTCLAPGSADRAFEVGGMTITSELQESVYRPGRQLLWNLLQARARKGGIESIVDALHPWMQFLLQHARVTAAKLASSGTEAQQALSAYVLPGDFLDCTPFNLLQGEHELFAIDAEWQSKSEVSLGWVVTRSVLWSLMAGMPSANHGASVTEVVERLCAKDDLSVSRQDIQAWLDLEADFQSAVLGHDCEDLTAIPASSGLRSFISEIAGLRSKIELLNERSAEREREVKRSAEREREVALEITSLNGLIAELQHSAAEREGHIANLDALVAQEKSNFIGLDQSLQQTRQEFEQSKSQLHQSLRELDDARRQLAMIQGSLSWRATAVLRTLSNSHPRARKLVGRIVRLAWWTVTLQLPFRLRDRRRLFQTRDTIAASGFFDATWYRNRYTDVAASECDPALHYALFGASERRNPGPRFDAGWYLDRNSDIAAKGVNPLLHYLTFGMGEGREIRAVAEASGVPAPPSETKGSYEEWIERYDTLTEEDVTAIRRHLASLASSPLISVVMRVDNANAVFLRKALDSVLGQLYPRWELCVADDGSTDPEIGTILKDYGSRDRRIKVTFRATNGHIAGASNSALEMVTGDFVALMDHEDELAPHALYMVAVELNENPDTDIIYSDEDKIAADGRRHGPFFKTDWNRELFYAQNMVNHLGVYRASLVKEMGGFREGFEGSQDYDLALRILARTEAERIRHIPYVLYHRRGAKDGETFSIVNRPTAAEAARRALADHFESKGKAVRVVSDATGWFNRVICPLPDPAPRVSLIVPTRDKVALLRTCIDGLLHQTRYPNLEVIIVDNDSCEPETLEYFESLRNDSRVRILHIGGAFNYAAFNNQAVASAGGDLIGFVNNDIEVIEPGWLEEMVSQATQPGVGAVGAKLYYRDDTIQHAGVVLGMRDVADHVHKHLPRSASGYFGRLQVVQNVSCVTAACMILPKRVFVEVGGFDEINLKVAYNDVDLCIRIREAGYSIIWTPYAELYHLESASRGYGCAPENFDRETREAFYMKRRWGTLLAADPFHSPNFTLKDPSLDLAFPPRVGKPWRRWKTIAGEQEPFRVQQDNEGPVPELSEVFSYISTPVDASALPKSVAIGVSSLGNFFMAEIARMLEDAFRQLGVPARLFTESEALTISRDDAVFVVAPHEFFHLGEGPRAFDELRHVPTLVMVNTEQRQTPWFAIAELYLRQATAVLDINYESAQQLLHSGYKAFALPLGYSDYIAHSFDGRVLPEHELFKHMPASVFNVPSSYADRPIDVLFVGTSSPRRQEFFCQNAGFFSAKNTFIYIPDGDKPFAQNGPMTIDFSTFAALVRRSKVLLNIHRDDTPYLEWQRIVTLGIMQKTLVVTEHCQPGPCIEPNVDYLDGPLQALPAFCDFALTNIKVADEIAERAYHKLQMLYPMKEILGRCWSAVIGKIGVQTC